MVVQSLSCCARADFLPFCCKRSISEAQFISYVRYVLPCNQPCFIDVQPSNIRRNVSMDLLLIPCNSSYDDLEELVQTRCLCTAHSDLSPHRHRFEHRCSTPWRKRAPSPPHVHVRPPKRRGGRGGKRPPFWSWRRRCSRSARLRPVMGTACTTTWWSSMESRIRWIACAARRCW